MLRWSRPKGEFDRYILKVFESDRKSSDAYIYVRQNGNDNENGYIYMNTSPQEVDLGTESGLTITSPKGKKRGLMNMHTVTYGHMGLNNEWTINQRQINQRGRAEDIQWNRKEPSTFPSKSRRHTSYKEKRKRDKDEIYIDSDKTEYIKTDLKPGVRYQLELRSITGEI